MAETPPIPAPPDPKSDPKAEALADMVKQGLNAKGLDGFIQDMRDAGATVEIQAVDPCPNCGEATDHTVIDNPPRMQCVKCQHAWLPPFPEAE